MNYLPAFHMENVGCYDFST